MIRADLTLCLEIEGPLLTRSTAPGEFGVDAVVARDHEGVPYIAGSHLAGKIRQALEEMADLDGKSPGSLNTGIMDQITGKPADNFQPRPKAVFISDMLLQNCGQHGRARSRIQVDRQRGSVKRGALLVMEAPFASGQSLYFIGVISIFAASEREFADYEQHIETALKWTTQVGGYRTIGFGRLREATLKRKKISTYDTQSAWPGPGRAVDLLIHPDHPFCMAEKQVDKNLFESKDCIPGGAMAGSIVTTWRYLAGDKGTGALADIRDPDRRELKGAFDQLSISHAFPSGRNLSRPVVPPLSLVKVDAEGCLPYYDVALCEKPCLIHGQVPAFAPDWKDRSGVLTDFGWPALQRDMRVRTAIDPEHLRSREAQLFAYETVVPGDHLWLASLTIPQGHVAGIGSQLAGLLEHGITGLGKTKTTASVRMMPRGTIRPTQPSHTGMRDGLWVITLQTPALLADPEEIRGRRGRQFLRRACQQTWSQISGNSLCLVRFFARQRLAGGTWLYSRFQQGTDTEGRHKPYYPWLLTTEGSVFVLKPVDGQEKTAAECIADWFENGLPLPDWARKRYQVTRAGQRVAGDHWSACPYIRRNGYGEIAVNLDVHWANRPEDGIRQDIDQFLEEKTDES